MFSVATAAASTTKGRWCIILQRRILSLSSISSSSLHSSATPSAATSTVVPGKACVTRTSSSVTSTSFSSSSERSLQLPFISFRRRRHHHHHHRGFSSSSSNDFFANESEYHTVADETLEDIQDTVEFALEEHFVSNDSDDDEEFEVVYADGVLTMSFGHHGTWVLNKQTPNKQIWWSSPISGPRRYEYDDALSEWVYTRANNNNNNNNDSDNNSNNNNPSTIDDKNDDLSDDCSNMTLTNTLRDEINQMYGIQLEFK